VEPFAQHLARRQLGQVLGDVNAALVEIEVLDGLALATCAEDDAERSLLARLPFVAIQPAQVQRHLPRVGGLEIAELELDRHEPVSRRRTLG
jgi:hypothetical protein